MGDPATVRRRFLAAEVEPELLWRLVAWCVAHGADEFTIAVMALAGTPAELADAFEGALDPWTLPSTFRPVLDASDGPTFPGRVRLWALNASTLPLLRRFLPHGSLHLGALEPGDLGWFENLTVYRGGDLLFAALGNEGVGVLQLLPGEEEQVTALGIALLI